VNAISELKLTVDRLSTTVQTKSEQASSAQGSLAQQAAYLSEMERKVNEMEAQRRALHNQVQELKGNIRVFCRVRPGGGDTAKAIEASADTKLSIAHKDDTHNFSFDKVFGPNSTQQAVYAEVDGLVQSALDGYKVCIFAYGQTGSGKTYTMQGGSGQAELGLIPRALQKILSLSASMANDGWQWTLTASFLEIYNETIRDLLHTGKGDQNTSSYAIKKDEVWGSIVANMGKVQVSSMEQIAKLMTQAAKARAVGATNMNAQSSRSHSVFALYLKGVNAKLNTEVSARAPPQAWHVHTQPSCDPSPRQPHPQPRLADARPLSPPPLMLPHFSLPRRLAASPPHCLACAAVGGAPSGRLGGLRARGQERRRGSGSQGGGGDQQVALHADECLRRQGEEAGVRALQRVQAHAADGAVPLGQR
jgi:hypothetical protein